MKKSGIPYGEHGFAYGSEDLRAYHPELQFWGHRPLVILFNELLNQFYSEVDMRLHIRTYSKHESVLAGSFDEKAIRIWVQREEIENLSLTSRLVFFKSGGKNLEYELEEFLKEKLMVSDLQPLVKQTQERMRLAYPEWSLF
jgi:hypothetical protein